jgi:hypothetical protein
LVLLQTPNSHTNPNTTGQSLVLLAHVGCQALNVLDQTVAVDFDRLGEQIFCSLRGISAQVAFSDFSTNNFAGTGHAEAFGRSLMSLYFVLSTTLFTWHDQTPLRKSNGRERSQPLVNKPIANYTR